MEALVLSNMQHVTQTTGYFLLHVVYGMIMYQKCAFCKDNKMRTTTLRVDFVKRCMLAA